MFCIFITTRRLLWSGVRPKSPSSSARFGSSAPLAVSVALGFGLKNSYVHVGSGLPLPPPVTGTTGATIAGGSPAILPLLLGSALTTGAVEPSPVASAIRLLRLGEPQ